jgi:hypothetical protein
LPHQIPVQPFETIYAHIRPPQLRGLDHGAHVFEAHEQPGELFVVEDGIGLDQGERRAEADGLAHGEAGLHALPACEGRRLPHSAAVFRGEDGGRAVGEIGTALLLAAEGEERNPEADRVVAPHRLPAVLLSRDLVIPFARHPVVKPEYIPKIGSCKRTAICQLSHFLTIC